MKRFVFVVALALLAFAVVSKPADGTVTPTATQPGAVTDTNVRYVEFPTDGKTVIFHIGGVGKALQDDTATFVVPCLQKDLGARWPENFFAEVTNPTGQKVIGNYFKPYANSAADGAFAFDLRIVFDRNGLVAIYRTDINKNREDLWTR